MLVIIFSGRGARAASTITLKFMIVVWYANSHCRLYSSARDYPMPWGLGWSMYSSMGVLNAVFLLKGVWARFTCVTPVTV